VVNSLQVAEGVVVYVIRILALKQKKNVCEQGEF
jgi:hypothetical protein